MDEQVLHAYLDGELGAAEKVKLEGRLKSDPALAAKLEGLRGLFEALAQVEELELSRDLTPGVMGSLTIGTPNRRALAAVLVAQSALAVLLAGLIWPLVGAIGEVIKIPVLNVSLLGQQFDAALTGIALAGSGRWIALQSMVADAAARFSDPPMELSGAAAAWPYVFSAALGLLLLDGLLLRYWQARRNMSNGS